MVAKKQPRYYNFDKQFRGRNENHKSNFIDKIPKELLTPIIARVASSSIGDLFNAKLTCKTLKSICDDSYVLKNATLEKIPIISWDRSKERFQKSFLELCRQNFNPEALYRKGVVDYFQGESKHQALECLKVAKKFGHEEASYAIGIILILAGEKQRGTQYLCAMKKDKNQFKEVKKGRKKLNEILKNMWIKNKEIAKERPTCCSLEYHQHMYRRKTWSSEFDEENIECEACLCHSEINSIYTTMRGF